VFDDAIIPVIKDLLRSNNGRSRDAALEVLSMAANHGKPIEFSAALHADKWAGDVRTRLFDDAMRAEMMPAIPGRLSSDSESCIEAAIKLLPFAVNHGKLVYF
jgi:hypothetical protein